MPLFVPSVTMPDGSRVSAVPTIPVDQGGIYTPVPDVLVTGGGLEGIAPRLRVDVGQTGFFAGREFRTFKELNIAASDSLTIRINCIVNTIAFGLTVAIGSGALRLATVVGGTPGGVFSDVLPVIGRNTMIGTPAYVAQNSAAAGGTHTGGTEIDVIRLKTNNNTNQATTIGTETGDERGVAPGTFYLRFTNLSATDAVAGVFRLRWEERP